LVKLVQEVGLLDIFTVRGPFTVFAPFDSVFANIFGLTRARLQEEDWSAHLSLLQEDEWSAHLEDLLLYHVFYSQVTSSEFTNGQVIPTLSPGQSITVSIEGGVLFIDQAEVAISNISASNGVIYAIDSILLPDSVTKNILNIADSDPAFSTLAGLIHAADLESFLTGSDPFTVFAPTDEAFDTFANLDPDMLDLLTDPDNQDTIVEIVSYHVLPGIVPSKEFTNGMVLESLQGSPIVLSVSDGSIMVNDFANVSRADLLVNNGIIHAIDNVLGTFY
jgi:transforming growth factor-beta-induced protein